MTMSIPRLDWFLGAVFLGAIVVYGLGSNVRSEIVILFYVYALLGLGQYIPLRLTDQVSLAYSAYFGIGAYTVGIVSAKTPFDAAIAVPLGMLVAGVIAGIVAISTQRLSGYFLAVTTLLVAVVFERFLLDADALTGGPAGMSFERGFLGLEVSRQHLLIAGAVIVWLVAVAVRNVMRSDLGQALLLMAKSATAAESVGLETSRARIVALFVGAALASLAGSIFALNTRYVVPESFGVGVSFLVLFIPFIGGAGSPWGCLVGAALVAYVLQVAYDFSAGRLLFGLAVLGFVVLFPAGVLGTLDALRQLAGQLGRSRRPSSSNGT